MIVTMRPCGVPTPQGSIAYKGLRKGKPIMVSDNAPTLKVWRRQVEMAAREALGAAWTPLDEPVEVLVRAYLPPPKRRRWWLPAVKPDVDKLARAILDGLADADTYRDDSRVVGLNIAKRYASDEHPVGARIMVCWGYDLSA